jgi:hypothetical protein
MPYCGDLQMVRLICACLASIRRRRDKFGLTLTICVGLACLFIYLCVLQPFDVIDAVNPEINSRKIAKKNNSFYGPNIF